VIRLPKPPADEKSRLLDAYRARATTAAEEAELFSPQFDVERFARQLNGLSGVKAVRTTLESMLSSAPPPLLAAALRVLGTLVVPGEKLPQAVLDAADSPEPEVQSAALSVLAAAGEFRTAFPMGSANPGQTEFNSGKTRKDQEGACEIIYAGFSPKPSARLRWRFRAGVSGIREMSILSSEDTRGLFAEPQSADALALPTTGIAFCAMWKWNSGIDPK
jgi:hypothetical protein